MYGRLLISRSRRARSPDAVANNACRPDSWQQPSKRSAGDDAVDEADHRTSGAVLQVLSDR
jgi:hypothetical protein